MGPAARSLPALGHRGVTAGNLGHTGLRLRRRSGCPLADYDRLPADLRAWLADALLPWSPRSAARAFARALARHGGNRAAAFADLDDLQEKRLSCTVPAGHVPDGAKLHRAHTPGPNHAP